MNILSLDMSLSNSGGCVFSNDGKPIYIFSISTSSKIEHKDRLRIIGDYLTDIKNKFDIRLVILENGFSRFNNSTQALFKTIGVASYIFSDCKQIYYAPSTIKKVVTGNGRADKKDVEKFVLKKFPDLLFENEDQSDACGVGLCYFIQEGIIKNA